MDCKIGDVVKITWQDVGANHEYYPIEDIEELLNNLRKQFTVITYGEVILINDDEIVIAYAKIEDEARMVYLLKSLIKSIKVLK